MALQLNDRVKESSITTGVVPIVLTGSPTGYQNVASSISTSNTFPYVVELVGGFEWEIGVGQYVSSNNSIIRTQILNSSNNSNIVDFSAGTKNVFISVPAAYMALTATGLSQFSSTTSAELASIISDETGSGKLVFSNNAVLVTPNIGVANGTSLSLSSNISSNLSFVGSSANNIRFPNALSIVSNVSSSIQHNETHNIGLIAEGVANASNTSIYGIGVYGVGYTNSGTRSGGVVGEGHVTTSSDGGSAIGVRGYANDTHAGGLNVGLYGDAANGSANYALAMNNGNILSNFAQTWYLNGGLTFTGGANTVVIPNLVSSNAYFSSANGSAPFSVISNTIVSNLNVDLLDGQHGTYYTGLTGLAWDTANTGVTIATAAFNRANTETIGQAAFGQANSAFGQANTGVTIGQAAFNRANTETIGQAAFGQANSAYTQANTGVSLGQAAFTQANTGVTVGQAAFNRANTETIGQAGFTQANTGVTIAQAAYSTANTKFSSSGGTISGSVTITTDLNVTGNVYLGGNVITLSSNNLSINDPLIYLAQNNPGNLQDIGVVGHFTSGTYQHTGFARDATDGVWKLFSNVSAEPTTTIDFSSDVIYDPLKVGSIITSNAVFLVANGTAPLTVSSTTVVTNLNSDYLDGQHGSYYTTAGNLSGTIPSAVLGNSTHYIGTTAVTLNRASASLALTGVSIDGNAGTVTTPTFSGDSVDKDDITTRTESGFYQSSTGTTAEGWPVNSGQWQHMIACTHSNDANYYSMQIGGGFYDNVFYGRKVNGTGTTAWVKFLTSDNYNTYASPLAGSSSITTTGTVTSGTWSASFGAVSGANLTGLTAGNLSGTIPSAVLGNSTHYIGTTAVTLNRASASLALTGITSIDSGAASLSFQTNSNTRMTLGSSGNVGIGGAASAEQTLAVKKNITGATFASGVSNAGQVQSDVTSRADYFQVVTSTAAGSYNTILGYQAQQGTLTGAVATQIGYHADDTLTGATNNYGFYGGINASAGTTRYNLYMGGTAGNYLAGNLGIGTTAPVSKLHVQALGASNGTINSRTGLHIQNANITTGTASARIQFSFDAATPKAWIEAGVYGSDYLAFGASAGATENMRIDSSGNVGIGRSAPSAKLHVQNSTDGILNEPTGTWAAKIYQAADGPANNGLVVANRWAADTSTAFEVGSLYGNGTGAWTPFYKITGIGTSIWSQGSNVERMRLDSSGNFGIGANAPSEKLHVNGNILLENNFAIKQKMANGTATNLIAIDSSNTFKVGGGYSTTVHIHPDAAADTYLHFNNAGSVVVGNNATATNMYIQNGSLTIGNGLINSGYKLQVNGSFAATTKSFVIDHPTKPDMKLRYGSLESPYHGVRLTGEGVLVNGNATIELPDYIHGLCKQEGSQVQITNIKHGKVIWVEDIEVDNNKFTVAADVNDDKEYKFYWSFTAIRKDIEDMVVEF